MTYQDMANRLRNLMAFDASQSGELPLSQEEFCEMKSLQLIFKTSGHSINEFEWTE